MRYRIKILQIILFVSLSIHAQNNAAKIHIRDLNSKSIEVNSGGKIYNYDFIFPQVMSIDSYFVSTTDDIFYIKYEYTGSAISKYFDLVGFRWKDGNIYLKEYVIMNNQKGKWTGVARILNEKLVKNYEDVESIITSFKNESEVSVVRNSKRIGKIKIPKKIATELIIDDKIFFEILNDAKKYK
ncbi:hypothetical protein FNO01nite_34490 [Flavobacterium noncentrifugens]|uniref:GLPGLI family protein n=1 Tax=Flavobacterium noncentrifugens TaxID=1128970 RepID=A0A1G9C2B0_9FLAO|nr:hypothetical protein [Flavobacterium noncentrifugens]GEP52777.1 hypothetical protein FNO01nite_34490 [Flavobacterium noncentrifugens]SDK45788.1 hypothetical protein SAMN04487935_3448 [Flavobacterium noncentrifugens]